MWSRKQEKLLDFFTSDFVRVQHALRALFPNKDEVKIYIELPPRVVFENQQKAKDTADNMKTRARVVSAIGGNVRESELLLAMLRDQGWDVDHVPPVARKKWTLEEFHLACQTQRSANQHEIDACRIAMTYANRRPELER